jgi:hypothetical protein
MRMKNRLYDKPAVLANPDSGKARTLLRHRLSATMDDHELTIGIHPVTGGRP